jgi:hypothetical protein
MVKTELAARLRVWRIRDHSSGRLGPRFPTVDGQPAKHASSIAKDGKSLERSHPDDTQTNIPAVPTRDFHDFLPVFVCRHNNPADAFHWFPPSSTYGSGRPGELAQLQEL